MISPEKAFFVADFKVDVYQLPPPKILNAFWCIASNHLSMVLSGTEKQRVQQH